MRRILLFSMIILAYGAILLLAWNFGPKLFELPVMTAAWVWIIGLALLCGIPCGISVVRVLRQYQREHRKEQGLCVQCGYDLRASMDRCPECGTHFTRPSLDEIMAPFRKQVAESGMSDEELDDFLRGELEAHRREKKAKS